MAHFAADVHADPGRVPDRFRIRGGAGNAGQLVARGDGLRRRAGGEGIAELRIEVRERETSLDGSEGAIRPELHSAPAGSRRILVVGATVHGAVDDDLVARIDLEEGARRFAAARQARLRAQLELAAARRTQVEVESRGTPRAIGELRECRRLESGAGARVETQIVGEAICDTPHRQAADVRLFPAVVGIRAHDVAVGRFEMHVAVAHAGDRAPGGGKIDLALHVSVAVAHFVPLVTARGALHAEVVDEAAARLALRVVFEPGRDACRQAFQRKRLAPAQDRPAEAAVQVHDAAGAERAHSREREVLRDLEPSGNVISYEAPACW